MENVQYISYGITTEEQLANIQHALAVGCKWIQLRWKNVKTLIFKKMQVYVSLLRGINVGGKNLIKMSNLKAIYESLNFENVQTYLQSGNLVFFSKISDVKEIQRKIENLIFENYSIKVPVLILTKEQLEKAIVNNPFLGQNKENSFIHYTFLSEEITMEVSAFLNEKKSEKEEFFIGDKVIYLFCPDGYGSTKLNNNYIEKKCHVSATTRNFKTTNELLKMIESSGL